MDDNEAAAPTRAHPTTNSTLLQVEGLDVQFSGRRGRTIHAVQGLDLTIAPGETLGLVGESGSGKSTTGSAILRRYQPSSGRIVFDGQDITGYKGRRLRAVRKQMQMVFQDPYSSLNPRMRVADIVGEPLVVHGESKRRGELTQRVTSLIESCGLPESAMDKYPSAFSGGERQRIAIARALALSPRLIVADEAVSALDVSIQAQIVNLLVDLQRRANVAYLFISHDLAVVRHIAHRVMIMYAGKVMEVGATEDVFRRALNPYTEALLSAAPVADPRVERARKRIVLKGEIPGDGTPHRGCPFNTRCPRAEEVCFEAPPPLEEKEPGRWSACWFVPKREETTPSGRQLDVNGPRPSNGTAF